MDNRFKALLWTTLGAVCASVALGALPNLGAYAQAQSRGSCEATWHAGGIRSLAEPYSAITQRNSQEFLKSVNEWVSRGYEVQAAAPFNNGETLGFWALLCRR